MSSLRSLVRRQNFRIMKKARKKVINHLRHLVAEDRTTVMMTRYWPEISEMQFTAVFKSACQMAGPAALAQYLVTTGKKWIF